MRSYRWDVRELDLARSTWESIPFRAVVLVAKAMIAYLVGPVL